ncbi:MAG: DUF973 family protein [Thaumarchaeota archaeon]|nr:DUF973 family protein [Nitrososphaerota archaeon]
MSQQASTPFQPSNQSQSSDAPIESSALSKVTWFAILQLVVAAGGFVTYLIYFPAIFSSFMLFSPGSTPSTSATLSLLQGLFNYLTVTTALALVIQIMAIFTLWMAFRGFSKVDRTRFSIPGTLTLVLIIGLGLVAVGVVLLFNLLAVVVSQAIQSTTANPFTAGQLGSFFAAIAVLGIGGLLALVGVIGGEILGLWRVGTRYESTLIKVGAIFVVIPLLNLVGPVLILIGTLEAKHRLKS